MNKFIKAITAMMLMIALIMITGCEKENMFYKHGFYDLGLPSGNLWATCNVGADSPEEYGDYFAWGETNHKDFYNWTNYLYCDGSERTLTKYCNNPSFGLNGFVDSLDVLETVDDVANTRWGGDWRTPTAYDWYELFQYTTHHWANMNGVNGVLFVGEKGLGIFLPAAGIMIGDSLEYDGVYGYYNSNQIETILDPSRTIQFFIGADECFYGGNYFRFCGRTVRPVRSAE